MCMPSVMILVPELSMHNKHSVGTTICVREWKEMFIGGKNKLKRVHLPK